MSSFPAFMIDKKKDAKICSWSINQLSVDDLPDQGDVVVDVDYSCLNFKDAMIIKNGGNIVRTWPFVPGIDFAGRVESSADPRYQVGDQVVLTGWRVGEAYWGGLAGKARVKADWLVPLPASLSTKQAMSVGTAGFAAMLGILAMERAGLTPQSNGSVLVTGATGGVGSLAVAMLKGAGYHVTASTRSVDKNTSFLTQLGADEVIGAFEDAPTRPLADARWKGCIENIGGNTLSSVLAETMWRCPVASVGLAASPVFTGNVIPFLLRGVNLLGVESAAEPYDTRVAAWTRIASDMPLTVLEDLTTTVPLSQVHDTAAALLKGDTTGRIVVDCRH
jgi:acrylyl-CoA reductase (NADPH)